MKYKICYNGKYEDELEIEGETLEEIRNIAFIETERRGWDSKDCYSYKIED